MKKWKIILIKIINKRKKEFMINLLLIGKLFIYLIYIFE